MVPPLLSTSLSHTHTRSPAPCLLVCVNDAPSFLDPGLPVGGPGQRKDPRDAMGRLCKVTRSLGIHLPL